MKYFNVNNYKNIIYLLKIFINFNFVNLFKYK